MSETPDAAGLERETGQEKATTTCPTCGATLGVVESPYGSTSAETCKKCFPPADPDANARQQAGAQPLARETGTVVTTPVTPPVPPTSPASLGSTGSEGGV